VIKVNEKIDGTTAQLPSNYLNMSRIMACSAADERTPRLYWFGEVCHLKTFLYLPLFLQQCGPDT
jgi:hypothetical protein